MPYSNEEQKILDWVSQLSKSQGLYCRLLEQLKEDRAALSYLAAQGFNDPVDLVLFVEQ